MNERYSIDADPDGIRALVADAIHGALAFGFQGVKPPPEGHWLTMFWKIGRDALAAQPAAEPTTPKITVDFRQATELLELFGGEPADITLMTGNGHSGPGLYAVFNADPDGAVYLGEADEEAVPVAAQPARAGGDAPSLAGALARLEAANNSLCAMRTRSQYLDMIDSGQSDALAELDAARAEARAALAAAPAPVRTVGEEEERYKAWYDSPEGRAAVLQNSPRVRDRAVWFAALAAAPQPAAAEPAGGEAYSKKDINTLLNAFAKACSGGDVLDRMRATKAIHDYLGVAFAAARAVEQPAASTDEEIEALAVARYKVVPAHSSMFWSHAVVAGDGQQQLYVGREVECQNMARKFAGAFLDGAFVAQQPAASTVPATSNLVPGQMRCARCKFQLTRSVLYVSSGTVGAGDSKTEPCPNGCGPLWPVTWEEAALDAWATCDQMFERAKAAEEKLAAITADGIGSSNAEAGHE